MRGKRLSDPLIVNPSARPIVALSPEASLAGTATRLPFWWPISPTPSPANGFSTWWRPAGLDELQGLASWGDRLLALEGRRGYLLELDPIAQTFRILNPNWAWQLRDSHAVAVESGPEGSLIALWFACHLAVYRVACTDLESLVTIADLEAYRCWQAPFGVESLAIGSLGVYATCYAREKILLLDPGTGELIQEWPAPGIGREHLMLQDQALWVSDRTEETLFVLDPKTGRELARILSPWPHPTGIATWRDQIWVAAATREDYIYDSPNDPIPLSVDNRPKTLVAPLRLTDPSSVQHMSNPTTAALEWAAGDRAFYTLSGGYRVEMTYLEEVDQEEPRDLLGLEWRIALPVNSRRQVVRSVMPLGQPFRLETEQDQSVAVYSLGSLQPQTSRLFGWRAVLDLYNIKYLITPADVENARLPPELARQYLVDDDELAMDHPLVKAAAHEAIGTETNLLRKMSNIRRFVYDKLSYRVTPRIDPPDLVLTRGIGSCGEYVGVLLALARLNGIACRTVGRYKCPPQPELKGVPLYAQYNHVWIEFYLPGFGWVPMESNVDDLGDGPHPQRYFMGLSWTHAEIAKGIPFETINRDDVSLGQLAINHVQFRILEEI